MGRRAKLGAAGRTVGGTIGCNGHSAVRSERWPGACTEEIPRVGLGPRPARLDS
jgi:hypothetical protein